MRNKQINKILNNLLDIAKNEKCNIYKARINAHIRAFIMKNDINYTIILNSAKKINLAGAHSRTITYL